MENLKGFMWSACKNRSVTYYDLLTSVIHVHITVEIFSIYSIY